jgi:hypothetical protein
VSDIDIAVVDSLKVLDPEWPIREADMHPQHASDLISVHANSPLAELATSAALDA